MLALGIFDVYTIAGNKKLEENGVSYSLGKLVIIFGLAFAENRDLDDSNTLALSLKMQAAFVRKFGHKPFFTFSGKQADELAELTL